MNGEAIRIAAVGDIMLGDSFYCIGKGVRSVCENQPEGFIFSHVRDLLRGHEIVFGNLESVLSDAGLNKGRLSSLEYRGGIRSVRDLKQANFNVLSVANNHFLQQGYAPVKESVQELIQNDILPIGRPGEGSNQEPGRILFIRGEAVGLLAYCLNLEAHTQSLVPDHLQVISEVRRLAGLTDLLIVSLHWGAEYMSYPSPDQVEFAHMLIDSGADIILGHHPHVLQGIETYGKGLIAYSLGNFVFNAWNEAGRQSIILSIQWQKNHPLEYAAIPVRINAAHQPVPLEGIERISAQLNLDRLCRIQQKNLSRKPMSPSGYAQEVARTGKTIRKAHRRYILGQIPGLPGKMALQLLLRPFIKRMRKGV